MANNAINIKDREEYERVFNTVSREEFDEARDFIESNPKHFYAQLVALLWSAEDWEICGEDYEEDNIRRDILDTIQGIAARDTAGRNFAKLCNELRARHPEWNTEDIIEVAHV